MNKVYFIIDGIKYIVSYENEILEILKEQDEKLRQLTDIEKEEINALLNKDCGYVYYSERLNNIVVNNNMLYKKDYLLVLLNWLESGIPENYRENFYRNLSTLTAELNFDLFDSDFIKYDVDFGEQCDMGSYNTRKNILRVDPIGLRQVWKAAQSKENPHDFYWRHYSLTLLHELTHMASSRFDKNNNVSYSGFDKYPPTTLCDKNSGLTEGFTEVIAMAGIPGTVENASKYYIECCLINQLMQIVGIDVLNISYFGNKGTVFLEEELCKLIDDKTKASKLFRFIEINYKIGNASSKQNMLGNIQNSLLDYLDKKLEILATNNQFEEIKRVIYIYENMLVTESTLELNGRIPGNYDGIRDNLVKFREIKERHGQNYEDNFSTIKK